MVAVHVTAMLRTAIPNSQYLSHIESALDSRSENDYNIAATLHPHRSSDVTSTRRVGLRDASRHE
jgi:hypothetical protein